MPLEKLIDRVRASESVLAALAAGRRLRRAAARHERPRAAARRLLDRCGEDADGLTQLLLVRALARIPGPLADGVLVAMLGDGDAGLRQHAAWALADRPPATAALPGLLRLAADGGFGTMLAQLAVERWRRDVPGEIFRQLEPALDAATDPSARARLAETLTLIGSSAARDTLRRLIRDSGEPEEVRAAAARGLLAAAALRAPRAADGIDPRGLRIAQVVLQGRVDTGLEGSGAGDSGGLATLLVSLGRALGRRPEVERVFTVARAFGGAGVAETYGRPEEPMGAGATLVRLRFGPERDLGVAEMWRHRLEIERGLERLFRRLGRLDGVHLRFADAGTLAASRVARRLGIPVFFSLAPDPHAAIRAAEAAGTLSRRTFARADRRRHLLFRAELVERMVRDARRLAVFPRPQLERDLADLLGVDVAADRRQAGPRQAGPRRFRTVPEGIDTRLPARAEREVRAPAVVAQDRRPVLAELGRAVEGLGAARRGLPLLVGLGRLHPVKGFRRLVEAWAGDPRLRRSFNLLVVGGDLDRPSATETRVLERIEEVLRRHPGARRGLLLFGRRSNPDAARLLAAARWGLGSRVGAGGVFVCASDKEEFGLAILEAMAAGLAVVAPDSGGPATYVRDGDNGFLARTTSVRRLRAAIHRAAAAAACDRRTERARRLVGERFTVDAMARALVRLYAPEEDGRALESAA